MIYRLNMGRFGLFLLLITVVFNPADAQQHPDKPENILPLDPAIRAGKLTNGFNYYLRRNTIEKGRAVLYLVNKVGSIVENDNQQGLAHFMEHMNFNGTTNFKGGLLVDYLEKAGVRFGADLNAYTGYDETVYQLPIQFDSPELIKNGLQVMRDWAQEALLETVEINKERGVILEEKRMGEGAGKRMQEKVMPILLNHTLYSNRMPIGTEKVLREFDPETLRAFYRDWYRPDLQSLVIVGDIDVDAIESTIKNTFGDLKNPEQEKERKNFRVELKGENHFLAVSDPENAATTIQIFIKHEAQKNRTASEYRSGIIRGLFNQLVQERFSALAQTADLKYIGAGAGINHLLANLDIFNASVTVKPEQLEQGFKAMWLVVSEIRNSGFTQTELDRAKYSLTASFRAALAERDKIPSSQYVQEYTRYILDGESSPGIIAESKLVNEFVPGITLEDLKSYARQYISDQNRDIIIEGTQAESASFPNEQTVLTWMAEANKLQHTFADVTDNKSLLEKLPVPGKVVSEKMIAPLGIVEMKMANGLKVVLKPTAFKNDQISFYGVSQGGTSVYADKDFQSAANAAGIISGAGLASHSPMELRNILNGKQVQVTPFINERNQGVAGGSSVKDFETALQLTYLYFTEPRKDSVLFRSAMEHSKSVFAREDRSPEKIFADTVNAVLNQGSTRRSGLNLEKIKQINLDRAYDIYNERFADPSGFTFIFDGSFDVNAIRPLLERYLGSLPAKGQKESARDLNIEIPKGKLEKTVFAGTGNKSTVKLVLSGNFMYSSQSRLELKALKEILEIRLLDRLRETEGGVYTPGTSLSISKFPKPNYALTVNFSCAPENVDKLITATWQEINKLRDAGPLTDDLQKFKAGETVGLKNNMQTNDFWMGYLSAAYTNGDDPMAVLSYEKQVENLNVPSLKKAAEIYLSDKNYIRLVLMPAVKANSSKK